MELVQTKTASEVPALEFRNVTMSFGQGPVLSDVSFVLERGQMICLTGSSNSGKSVLLRLAIGLMRPDSGQIFVNGREITLLDEADLLPIRGRSMGLVFQDESLFTSLSVYDNAAYRLIEQEWPDDEVERSVREILHFVGLEEQMDKFYEELSGGMKRRVEFARALAGWPEVMLFDEPTSGLDPINTEHVLDLVIRARDIHNISSVYVTKAVHEIPYLDSHIAAEDGVRNAAVSEMSKRGLTVMMLSEGRVAFRGSAAEFASSDLPEIKEMTDPQTDSPASDIFVADPWKKQRNGGSAF